MFEIFEIPIESGDTNKKNGLDVFEDSILGRFNIGTVV